ncbi:phage regulatory CII family protein [Variovorax sp. VNK109]|jgi:hypothetical protein|uniref:phage regulatory CII family protein n=1 Tax=Variovorax sp. VNK109 TaxID=3400919 RepID=UPI003C02059E
MTDSNASPHGGISLEDAAYHTGHDFPGGVPALAQRMAMSPNTLQHKLDPRNTTHKLSLREAQEMQAITQDFRVLHAMAASNGFIALSLGHTASGTTISEVLAMVKEFGDVLTAVNAALEDGKVSLNEMRECERQSAELFAAVNSMLRTVRSLMPRQPA